MYFVSALLILGGGYHSASQTVQAIPRALCIESVLRMARVTHLLARCHREQTV